MIGLILKNANNCCTDEILNSLNSIIDKKNG